MPDKRSARGRLAALLGSLALTLVGTEVVLRYRAYRTVQRRFEEILTDERQASLGSIKRSSRNDKIIYELKPDLRDVVFKDVPVSTSSLGFRGPEITVEKPPGTVRIVGLGDSVMFGWGVQEDESYLARLEALLREAHPERSWEVVNTGVPGYNTVMEVETLREKGRRLDPDIVVVGIVSNDLNLPTLLHRRRDYFALNESYVKSFVLECLGLVQPVTDLFVPVDRGATSWEIFEQDPSLVEPEYRQMVGWGAFDAALDDLALMAREDGFEVVALYLYWYEILRTMQAKTGARGFSNAVVMPKPPATEESGGDWLLEHGLILSLEDPHPSAEMHDRTARLLLHHLEETGILARAMESPR